MKIEWKGKFPYTKEKVNELVKNSSGIYMISVKLENGNYRPIYVGKAENLEERLLGHFSDSEQNQCLRNRIKGDTLVMRFAYVKSEEDRMNIEHTLYHKYDPKCNEQEPEGKIIDINFPY